MTAQSWIGDGMAAAGWGANRATEGKAFAAKLRVMGDAARTHEGKIHGSVVDAIGRWILGGTYAPNDLLPREDDLAVQLGVSRTSIRGAGKGLSAQGGLLARRGGGVRGRG